MLLLTHAYLVPADRLPQHDALLRQVVSKLSGWQVGFELLVETEPGFAPSVTPQVRLVQLLRFSDAAHFARVKAAESADSDYQKLLASFASLIDLPTQMASGTYVPGHYQRTLSAGL